MVDRGQGGRLCPSLRSPLQHTHGSASVVLGRRPYEKRVAVHGHGRTEGVVHVDVVTRDVFGVGPPALGVSLEEMDTARCRIDRSGLPPTGAPYEDFAVADRDGGSETRGGRRGSSIFLGCYRGDW